MNEAEIAQKRAECLEQIRKLREEREVLIEKFDSCIECGKRSLETACPEHHHISHDLILIDEKIQEIDGSMPASKEDIDELAGFIQRELH